MNGWVVSCQCAVACRRGEVSQHLDDIPVVATITALGLALLVGLTRDRRRQLPRAALLGVPATLVAGLLVSAPDLIEQLVLVGL